MPSLKRKTAVNESVVCAELDDEMVLLNVETGIYFGLDELGTRIWTLLAAGSDEEDIFSTLLAEYEVDPQRLRTDISAFLETLARKKLLRLEDC